MTEVVKSSGTVQPVQSVQVGSFVSGPISHIYVNFNAEVKKGQLLATIDELIPKANLAQAKAALASDQANLLQADAKLEQTKREWKRAQDLLPKKAIADSDYNLSKSAYKTAVAGVAVARADNRTMRCRRGDGRDEPRLHQDHFARQRHRDRPKGGPRADPGLDLSDAGPVRGRPRPEEAGLRVGLGGRGGHRDDPRRPGAETAGHVRRRCLSQGQFAGKIWEVRLTPTTTQNIVTYTVVVEAANAELKLLPGMTANLSFQITTRKGVLRVPNAAPAVLSQSRAGPPRRPPARGRQAVRGPGKADADADPSAAEDRPAKEAAPRNAIRLDCRRRGARRP